jgi:predicted nucleic acid-binding protein
MTKAKVISPQDALDGLHALFALNIREIPPTLELHREALQWAHQLGQGAAYDAAYLALAEQLQAPFWTADRRLANPAQQAGAAWVCWIGEDYPKAPPG